MTSFSIDSSVWIRYLFAKDKASAMYIDKNDLLTSTLALAEVTGKCLREGVDEELAKDIITERSQIVPVTESIAIEGARIKHKQRRTKPKFGLADGIQLASARQERTILVSYDKDFLGLKGVKVL